MKKFDTLYAGGCSWTQGAETAPDRTPESLKIMFESSWPWFVSRKHNINNLVNDGISASSNLRIFRRANEFIFNYLEQEKDPSSLLIVIGWTATERHEIGIGNKVAALTPRRAYVDMQSPSTEVPDDIQKYHEYYYKLYSDVYGEKLQILYMTNLRLLCKSLGIAYLDFITLGKSGKYFQQFPFLKDIVEESFQEYVSKNNLSVHQFNHPTKETHEIWADYISKKIS